MIRVLIVTAGATALAAASLIVAGAAALIASAEYRIGEWPEED